MQIYEYSSFMNHTFIQQNKLNEISQCKTKLNHMIHVFKNKYMAGEWEGSWWEE